MVLDGKDASMKQARDGIDDTSRATESIDINKVPIENFHCLLFKNKTFERCVRVNGNSSKIASPLIVTCRKSASFANNSANPLNRTPEPSCTKQNTLLVWFTDSGQEATMNQAQYLHRVNLASAKGLRRSKRNASRYI
jgi:hypothetical protein